MFLLKFVNYWYHCLEKGGYFSIIQSFYAFGFVGCMTEGPIGKKENKLHIQVAFVATSKYVEANSFAHTHTFRLRYTHALIHTHCYSRKVQTSDLCVADFFFSWIFFHCRWHLLKWSIYPLLMRVLNFISVHHQTCSQTYGFLLQLTLNFHIPIKIHRMMWKCSCCVFTETMQLKKKSAIFVEWLWFLKIPLIFCCRFFLAILQNHPQTISITINFVLIK